MIPWSWRLLLLISNSMIELNFIWDSKTSPNYNPIWLLDILRHANVWLWYNPYKMDATPIASIPVPLRLMNYMIWFWLSMFSRHSIDLLPNLFLFKPSELERSRLIRLWLSSNNENTIWLPLYVMLLDDRSRWMILFLSFNA